MDEANSIKAAKSEGTPICGEPAKDNGEERGVKRAVETNAAGNVKRIKDEIFDGNVKNPVFALQHKLKHRRIQYEYIGMRGPLHSPTYTMQTTIGDQVFKAEGTSKKEAKVLVAQAALQYLSESNVSMEDQLHSLAHVKKPTIILESLRQPHVKYDFRDTLSQGLHYCLCTVGDEQFAAKGRSKKLAKSFAAMYALQNLYNLKFTVSEFDGMPVFDGEEQEWRKYLSPLKKVLFKGRTPTVILNRVRQGTVKYECVEELPQGDSAQLSVHMKLTVGDEQFEAKAHNKILAKSFAAMYALQKLYNLKFTVSEVDGMPTFDGEEQEWRKYMPEPRVRFEGREPYNEMYNMYGHLKYVIMEADTPDQEDVKFKCTLKVENMFFNGTDSSRKRATSRACLEALQYLKKEGLLDQKRAEAAAKKGQKLAGLKVEQEAVQKSVELV